MPIHYRQASDELITRTLQLIKRRKLLREVIATNQHNLMLHQLLALNNPDWIRKWFIQQDPMFSAMTEREALSIGTSLTFKWYKDSLFQQCALILKEIGFKQIGVIKVRAKLPEHLSLASDKLIRQAVQASRFSRLSDFIANIEDTTLIHLLVAVSKDKARAFLSQSKIFGSLVASLSKQEFSKLWYEHCAPLLENEWRESSKVAINELRALATKDADEFLSETGVELSSIPGGWDGVKASLQGYPVCLEMHLVEMLLRELTAMVDSEQQVSSMLSVYELKLTVLQAQQVETYAKWHELRISLCLSLAMVKAVIQYERRLGEQANRFYRDSENYPKFKSAK